MAISHQLQDRIGALADELRKELYGPKGYPPWGTKFVEMEQQTGEVGDALACAMLSHGLQEQAEAEGHPAGKCGGCGEPIPFEEVAGRLLQARRGMASIRHTIATRCKVIAKTRSLTHCEPPIYTKFLPRTCHHYMWGLHSYRLRGSWPFSGSDSALRQSAERSAVPQRRST